MALELEKEARRLFFSNYVKIGPNLRFSPISTNFYGKYPKSLPEGDFEGQRPFSTILSKMTEIAPRVSFHSTLPFFILKSESAIRIPRTRTQNLFRLHFSTSSKSRPQKTQDEKQPSILDILSKILTKKGSPILMHKSRYFRLFSALK